MNAGAGHEVAVVVAVVMGSDSDLPVMLPAVEVLRSFDVGVECGVVSAHRAPEHMTAWGLAARARGIQVIIAGAGGAAHLPGMLASLTTLPVIGVPVARPHLDGVDSLLSIVQMPNGIPVATVAIDAAHNSGLLAARILGLSDPKLAQRLEEHRGSLAARAGQADASVRDRVAKRP